MLLRSASYLIVSRAIQMQIERRDVRCSGSNGEQFALSDALIFLMIMVLLQLLPGSYRTAARE
jgi:hypothetical protein